VTAIKHLKQTGLPADEGDTSVVQPTDWYADHDIDTTGVPAGDVLTADGAGDAAWAAPSLRKATVTLSSAQILALDGTPVTIVPAPGSGKWLVPHRVALAVDFATTPYVNGDTWPGLYYAGPGPQIKALDILSQASSARSAESPTIGADAANTDNVAIVAGYGSPSTDGDSPLIVTVWYTEEDAS